MSVSVPRSMTVAEVFCTFFLLPKTVLPPVIIFETLKEHKLYWKSYLWFLLLWQKFHFFPSNWWDPMQRFLLSNWRGVQLIKRNNQLWPSEIWYCAIVSLTRRLVLIITNMRTLTFTNYILLSWNLKVYHYTTNNLPLVKFCPKTTPTIFLIFILILLSTCLPSGSFRLEIVWPNFCIQKHALPKSLFCIWLHY